MINLAQFILQPQYTDKPQNTCGGINTNAQAKLKELQLHALNTSRWFPHRC